MEIVMKKEVKKDEVSLWLLAAIPMLVSILLHTAGTDHRWVSAIVFVLNIGFVSYDYFKTKATKDQPLSVYLSGLILIPLYLYFRAIKNGRQYKFLAVWAALYMFDLAILQMAAG